MDKVCKVCQQAKPVEMFSKDDHCRDGYRSTCRQCRAAAKREQYAADPEKFRAASRRWADKHPVENAQKARDWYWANPERVKEYRVGRADKERKDGKLRRAKNPEQRRMRARAWREAHPGYYKQRADMFPEQRRARRLINESVRRGDMPRASQVPCAMCGAQAQEYHHPDYSKPLDVTPVCKQCHAKIHYGDF